MEFDQHEHSFSWQDSVRACLNSTLSCLPANLSILPASTTAAPSTPSTGSRRERRRIRADDDEGARLLEDAEHEAEADTDALSLHSNLSPGSSSTRLRSHSQSHTTKKGPTAVFGRCFGYSLFGRPKRARGVSDSLGEDEEEEETSALPDLTPEDLTFSEAEGPTPLSESQVLELSTRFDSSSTIKARASTISSHTSVSGATVSTSTSNHQDEGNTPRLSKEERRAIRRAKKVHARGLSSISTHTPTVHPPHPPPDTHISQSQYLPQQPMEVYHHPYSHSHPHSHLHPAYAHPLPHVQTDEYGPFVQARSAEKEEDTEEMDFEASTYAFSKRSRGQGDGSQTHSQSGTNPQSRSRGSYASRSSASVSAGDEPRLENAVTAEHEPEFEGFNDTLVLPSSHHTTPKQKKSSSGPSSNKALSKSSKPKPKSKSKSKSAHSTNDSSSIASPLSSHFQLLNEDGVRVAEEDDEELGDIADRTHGLDFSEHALEFGLGRKQQQTGGTGSEPGVRES